MASLTRKCASSSRFSISLRSTRPSRMFFCIAHALLGGNVGAELARPARLRVAPGPAWLRWRESRSPSTSAAVVFDTPEKSRELRASPENERESRWDRGRAMRAICWPCRPSRIRCSIPCPKKSTLKRLAERTGLEPATPGVTGRYSNQLNYRSNFLLGAEGFVPPTLARSGDPCRRAGPGRRQKGAEFSRESEIVQVSIDLRRALPAP